MENAKFCLWVILFLNVLLLQVASADALTDKEPEGKDASQLATTTLASVLLRRC